MNTVGRVFLPDVGWVSMAADPDETGKHVPFRSVMMSPSALREKKGGNAIWEPNMVGLVEAMKAGWEFEHEDIPPVIAIGDETGAEIIDGHHRVEAAKRAGALVPVLLIDPSVINENVSRSDAIFSVFDQSEAEHKGRKASGGQEIRTWEHDGNDIIAIIEPGAQIDTALYEKWPTMPVGVLSYIVLTGNVVGLALTAPSVRGQGLIRTLVLKALETHDPLVLEDLEPGMRRVIKSMIDSGEVDEADSGEGEMRRFDTGNDMTIRRVASGSIVLYHGTSSESLKKIMSGGLLDPFLTDDRQDALEYGQEMAAATGSEKAVGVVLKVVINDVSKLLPWESPAEPNLIPKDWKESLRRYRTVIYDGLIEPKSLHREAALGAWLKRRATALPDLYHGTSGLNIEEIKKHGLRQPVFLTSNVGIAESWANHWTEMDEPIAVIRVRVPDVSKLGADDPVISDWAGWEPENKELAALENSPTWQESLRLVESVVYNGPIPPEFIDFDWEKTERTAAKKVDWDHVRAVAEQIRGQFVAEPGECSRDRCVEINKALAQALRAEYGNQVALRYGPFTDDLGGEFHHWWVEIGGRVIDAAADQFNIGIIDKPMPEIYIGERAPRYRAESFYSGDEIDQKGSARKAEGADPAAGPFKAPWPDQIQAFMQAVYDQTVGHPFTRGQRVWDGKVILEVAPWAVGPDREYPWIISLKWIQSMEPGQGNAQRAMTWLSALADQFGVFIDLHAKPTGEPKIPKRDLKNFYKEHGFEREPGHGPDDMLRNPLSAAWRARREAARNTPGGHRVILNDDVRVWARAAENQNDRVPSIVLPKGTSIWIIRRFKLNHGGSPALLEIKWIDESGGGASGEYGHGVARAVDVEFAGTVGQIEISDAKSWDPLDENVACKGCGRRDLPLHTDGRCPGCSKNAPTDDAPETPADVTGMKPAERQKKIDALLDRWSKEPEKRPQIEEQLKSLRAFQALFMLRRAADTMAVEDQARMKVLQRAMNAPGQNKNDPAYIDWKREYDELAASVKTPSLAPEKWITGSLRNLWRARRAGDAAGRLEGSTRGEEENIAQALAAEVILPSAREIEQRWAKGLNELKEPIKLTVNGVWLVGSRVMGTARSKSDWDFVVTFTTDPPEDQQGENQDSLIEMLYSDFRLASIRHGGAGMSEMFLDIFPIYGTEPHSSGSPFNTEADEDSSGPIPRPAVRVAQGRAMPRPEEYHLDRIGWISPDAEFYPIGEEDHHQWLHGHIDDKRNWVRVLEGTWNLQEGTEPTAPQLALMSRLVLGSSDSVDVVFGVGAESVKLSGDEYRQSGARSFADYFSRKRLGQRRAARPPNFARFRPDIAAGWLGLLQEHGVSEAVPQPVMDAAVETSIENLMHSYISHGQGEDAQSFISQWFDEDELCTFVALWMEHGQVPIPESLIAAAKTSTNWGSQVSEEDVAAFQNRGGERQSLLRTRWQERRANDPLKKTIDIGGVKIGIEWPKGTIRTWDHLPNNDYRVEMKADYGYIKGTEGDDGEEVDVYAGPNHESTLVFVVEQLKKEDGKYDEQKFMCGYDSKAEAKKSYLDHMEEKCFGGIEEMTWEKFLKLVPKSQKKKKALENAKEERQSLLRTWKRRASMVMKGDPVLWHGTTVDVARKALSEGVTPQWGEFVSTHHGEGGTPVVFAADSDNLSSAARAMMNAVAYKIGVSEGDVRAKAIHDHGAMLGVVFDKIYQLTDKGYVMDAKTGDILMDVVTPGSVERGDHFSFGPGQVVEVHIGDDLLKFFREHEDELSAFYGGDFYDMLTYNASSLLKRRQRRANANPDKDDALFAFQDGTIEHLPKDLQNIPEANILGIRLENAGDIFRELVWRDYPDPGYIGEKTAKIARHLTNPQMRQSMPHEALLIMNEIAELFTSIDLAGKSPILIAARDLNVALARQDLGRAATLLPIFDQVGQMRQAMKRSAGADWAKVQKLMKKYWDSRVAEDWAGGLECSDDSDCLNELLYKAGMPAEHISGYYSPTKDEMGSGGFIKLEERMSHDWLVLDGKIIDITHSQFGKPDYLITDVGDPRYIIEDWDTDDDNGVGERQSLFSVWVDRQAADPMLMAWRERRAKNEEQKLLRELVCTVIGSDSGTTNEAVLPKGTVVGVQPWSNDHTIFFYSPFYSKIIVRGKVMKSNQYSAKVEDFRAATDIGYGEGTGYEHGPECFCEECMANDDMSTHRCPTCGSRECPGDGHSIDCRKPGTMTLKDVPTETRDSLLDKFNRGEIDEKTLRRRMKQITSSLLGRWRRRASEDNRSDLQKMADQIHDFIKENPKAERNDIIAHVENLWKYKRSGTYDFGLENQVLSALGYLIEDEKRAKWTDKGWLTMKEPLMTVEEHLRGVDVAPGSQPVEHVMEGIRAVDVEGEKDRLLDEFSKGTITQTDLDQKLKRLQASAEQPAEEPEDEPDLTMEQKVQALLYEIARDNESSGYVPDNEDLTREVTNFIADESGVDSKQIDAKWVQELLGKLEYPGWRNIATPENTKPDLPPGTKMNSLRDRWQRRAATSETIEALKDQIRQALLMGPLTEEGIERMVTRGEPFGPIIQRAYRLAFKALRDSGVIAQGDDGEWRMSSGHTAPKVVTKSDPHGMSRTIIPEGYDPMADSEVLTPIQRQQRVDALLDQYSKTDDPQQRKILESKIREMRASMSARWNLRLAGDEERIETVIYTSLIDQGWTLGRARQVSNFISRGGSINDIAVTLRLDRDEQKQLIKVVSWLGLGNQGRPKPSTGDTNRMIENAIIDLLRKGPIPISRDLHEILEGGTVSVNEHGEVDSWDAPFADMVSEVIGRMLDRGMIMFDGSTAEFSLLKEPEPTTPEHLPEMSETDRQQNVDALLDQLSTEKDPKKKKKKKQIEQRLRSLRASMRSGLIRSAGHQDWSPSFLFDPVENPIPFPKHGQRSGLWGSVYESDLDELLFLVDNTRELHDVAWRLFRSNPEVADQGLIALSPVSEHPEIIPFLKKAFNRINEEYVYPTWGKQAPEAGHEDDPFYTGEQWRGQAKAVIRILQGVYGDDRGMAELEKFLSRLKPGEREDFLEEAGRSDFSEMLSGLQEITDRQRGTTKVKPSRKTEMTSDDAASLPELDTKAKTDQLLEQLQNEADPEKRRQIEQRLRSLQASVNGRWRLRRAGEEAEPIENRSPGAISSCEHGWPGKKDGERGWCGRCGLGRVGEYR